MSWVFWGLCSLVSFTALGLLVGAYRDKIEREDDEADGVEDGAWWNDPFRDGVIPDDEEERRDFKL